MAMLTEQNMQPLFGAIVPFSYQCDQCYDTGIWINYADQIAVCPYRVRRPHPAPNAAAQMLTRSMQNGKGRPSGTAWDFACMLTHFSTAEPCPTNAALGYLFGDTRLSHSMQLRKLALAVEELRQAWTLPVGSRKDQPAGYWIITDLNDCKAWLRHATAAPKTQLATIWRSAKAAFPVLAGQQEFSFMEGLETEGTESDADAD